MVAKLGSLHLLLLSLLTGRCLHFSLFFSVPIILSIYYEYCPQAHQFFFFFVPGKREILGLSEEDKLIILGLCEFHSLIDFFSKSLLVPKKKTKNKKPIKKPLNSFAFSVFTLKSSE